MFKALSLVTSTTQVHARVHKVWKTNRHYLTSLIFWHGLLYYIKFLLLKIVKKFYFIENCMSKYRAAVKITNYCYHNPHWVKLLQTVSAFVLAACVLLVHFLTCALGQHWPTECVWLSWSHTRSRDQHSKAMNWLFRTAYPLSASSHIHVARACNYVKFKTGRNLSPVLKIVTHAAQLCIDIGYCC